jgi:alpha-L-fucosidase 2
LLPALPAAWPAGSVRGLRARGGVTVDLDWKDGRLVRASFTADRDGTFRIRHADGSTAELVLRAGARTAHQPANSP